jgi:hypothetical protein
MATYNRPGVYVNELPLTSAPIVAGSSANAAGAVIAAFPKGPDTITRVTSWYDFVKRFGGYSAAYPATFSVSSFFKNGGTELYVRRILPASARTSAKVNVLSEPATVAQKSVSKVARNGSNVATITTSTAHTYEVGDTVTISGLTGTDYTGFNASNVTITAVPTTTTFRFTNTGSTLAEATPEGTGVVNGNSTQLVMTVAAKNRGIDGNDLRVVISESRVVRISGYYDVSVYLDAGVADTIVNNVVTAGSGDDTLVEQFNGVVTDDQTSGDYIATVLGFGSNYIQVLDGDVQEWDGTEYVTVTYSINNSVAPAVDTIWALSGAQSPEDSLTYADYTGNTVYNPADEDPEDFSVSDCAVFAEFETIDQPLVFFLPDVNVKVAADAESDPSGWLYGKAVYYSLIEWVEAPVTNGRHFVVIETEAGATVDEALSASGYFLESSRAAVYYPHIYTRDPIGRSTSSIRKIGPSGAVAGLFLYTDRLSGPFKAPAGITAKVVEAVALEKSFSPSELDALNSGIDTSGTIVGNNVVNAIRNIPGAGVVVMGARTLKQDGTANRYISMRRSLTYIEKKLNDLCQFALFENNSERLWARLNTVIGAFLNEYRNQGGLRGATVADSFYVKVDAENNSNATIQAGEVHIEVGVALEYPAEFVVINLSQKTAD